jgi:DNA-binding transcriptional ArsR family regulator
VHAESAVFAAIASPRRREILRLTWSGERGAGDIRHTMPDVSWGAVSLQIKALVDAGLLHARIDGRHRYYRADRARLASVAAMLERMWADALWKLKLAAELEASRRGPKSKVRRARPKPDVGRGFSPAGLHS